MASSNFIRKIGALKERMANYDQATTGVTSFTNTPEKGKFAQAVAAGRQRPDVQALKGAERDEVHNRTLAQEAIAKPIPKTPFKSPTGATAPSKPSENYARAFRNEVVQDAEGAAKAKAEAAEKQRLANAEHASANIQGEVQQAKSPTGLKALQEKYRAWEPERSHAGLVQQQAMHYNSPETKGITAQRVEEEDRRRREGIKEHGEDKGGVRQPKEKLRHSDLSRRQEQKNTLASIRDTAPLAVVRKDDHEEEPEKREEEAEETVPELVKKARAALLLAKCYKFHKENGAAPTGVAAVSSPGGSHYG